MCILYNHIDGNDIMKHIHDRGKFKIIENLIILTLKYVDK